MTSTASTSITVRHNFEAAHRLPHLRGKCENLHGHSWWASVTVTAPATDTVVEFGAFKRALRNWIDGRLDHGAMLGAGDPLAQVLPQHGKVFVFGADPLADTLDYPTVENVAALIARVAHDALHDLPRAAGAYVSGVTVHETHVNAASWTGEAP